MQNRKRIVVTGATGLIGRKLCARLEARGYRVVVFSRDPERARRAMPNGSEYVAWSAAEEGPWASAIDGAWGVVNLAGASIFSKRWSESYKRQIRESRVLGTRGLGNAMAQAEHRPSVFVSGSAVGYYGFRDDTALDESAVPGNDFLARTCVEWEQEAARAEEYGIRTVMIRTGVVLSRPRRLLPIALRGASLSRPGIILDTEQGALPLMAFPFRFYAGGPIWPGSQWFSWIHIDDLVGIIRLALENEQARGPLNATAPEALTQREFSQTLGRVMGRPSWLPLPGFALRLAMGEVATMLTKGQRVVPKKAQELGYEFKYATAEQALRDLLK